MTNFSIKNLISDRVLSVQPSGIRKFFDIVAEMKDAISLGVGEPDFVTPWHIRDAGIYSLESGHTSYTSNAGLLPLRREISAYMERRFDLKYDEALDTMAEKKSGYKIIKHETVFYGLCKNCKTNLKNKISI